VNEFVLNLLYLFCIFFVLDIYVLLKTFSSSCGYLFQERESHEMGSLARSHKTVVKNCKDKSSSEYKDNYEGDCDDDDYDEYECEANKRKDFSSHWKSTHKTALVNSTQQQHLDIGSSRTSALGGSEAPRPHNLELPYKLKSSKNTARDRRDKNVLKRRTTDKAGNLKGKYASIVI
jgi:hypothetical protein